MFSRPSPRRRPLFALIVGATVVPLAALVWLGWRLLEQDRLLEGQQVEQQLERAADLGVAALDRAISASEQQLANGDTTWAEGAVALTFREDVIEWSPPNRLAYLPVVRPLPQAPPGTFAHVEALEFRQRDHGAAIAALRPLTKSSDPAIRAEALLRLAWNLRNAGRFDEALSTYALLTETDDVASAGVPVALAARYRIGTLLEQQQRTVELTVTGAQLRDALQVGRWELTGLMYAVYAADAARWSGEPVPASATSPARSRPMPTAALLAEATGALWERWRSKSPAFAASGRELFEVDGQALVMLWHTSAQELRGLVATPSFVQSEWLAIVSPVAADLDISFELRNAEGNPVFGTKAARTAPRARPRGGAESGLPWTIVAVGADLSGINGEFALRRRLLVAGFVLLVLMVLTASYLIVRAVSRELAVARLQSDFVAAVSHEFRTPLTSLRQFTDMLRESPNLDDERRQVCYAAQSRATDRLSRLVESLLDFGRMEAGARRYTFERQDCTALVERVVEDFASQVPASGHDVAFHPNGSAYVDSDSDALARAVRNLLENAVKYSPDHRAVDVSLSRQDGSVRIAVHDHGIGIPTHERATIFGKFQRGEQARLQGIKGTGIGLAMVDEIVRAHQGRVEVESEPGLGSTFTIVLPARD